MEELYATKLDQLLLETRDIADEMNHRPNSVAKCREAFKAYLAAPSKQTKAVLHSAYEAIPEHNRRYVGDMDTQDVPVRMAIYGEEELESWSHRVVARAEGIEPLPTITVPQVDDAG